MWQMGMNAVTLDGLQGADRWELVREGRVSAVAVVVDHLELVCYGWDGEKFARLRLAQLTTAGALRGLERRYPGGTWRRVAPRQPAVAV